MASYTWRLVPFTGGMVSASILLDGTILGIDSEGNVYTRKNVACWLEVPNSGTMASVTVLQDGTLLGVGMNGHLYNRDTLYGLWRPANTSQNVLLRDVIELQNQSFLGVGTDYTLYTCNSSALADWTQVPNSGSVIGVAQIQNGSFIGVGSSDNEIYTRSSINAEWLPVPNSGSMMAVTQLMDGTYLGVNTDHALCTSSGLGSAWAPVQFSSGFIAISQLADGTLLGVTTGKVLSIAHALPSDWVSSPQGQAFLSIAQLQDGAFLGVGAADHYPRYARQLGGPWNIVTNPIPLIAVSQLVYGPQKGALLGVTFPGNELATCPTVGGVWMPISGSGSMASAIQAIDGTFMAIGQDQHFYISSGLGHPWQPISVTNLMLTVAQQADATLLGVGADKNIYLGRFSHLLGQIDTIVLFMLENRGFDSMLGYLYSPDDPPSAVIPPPEGDQLPFNGLLFVDTSKLANSATIDGKTITVSPAFPVRASDSPGVDPFEVYEHVNFQLFGSHDNPRSQPTPTMTGFLADYAAKWKNPDSSQISDIEQIMMMYTPADVFVLSTLAKSYAVSDEWFSSVPTQTNANRAFSMAGMSLGEVNNGMYSVGRLNKIFELDAFKTETIFNVLERSGFQNWGIFWQSKYPTVLNTQSYTWNSFPMISEYVPDAESNFFKIEQFVTMAENGTLPAFSFVEPAWGGAIELINKDKAYIFNGDDYHPPADTVQGENRLKELFTAINKNPAAWAKTLFIVTFDEHGGTYDHVPPPWGAKPPWGDGKPWFRLQNDFAFDRFGVRVPTILISPLIQEGTVFRSPSGVPYDHTSVIATILDWQQVDKRTWNLGARVASAPTFDNVITLTTPRTDNPFAPTQPSKGTPINYGDSFYLQNQNGNVVIKPHAGVGYYFPLLGPSGAVAHSFRLGFGPLASGSKVQIFTSQKLPNKIDMTYHGKPYVVGSLSTALGAWANEHDCYYYPTEDFQNFQQQVWIVNKVGAEAGAPIVYGDEVNLSSVYYSGQGLVANGNYLSTAPGTGDGWVLLPA
jgi:phospholipase C